VSLTVSAKDRHWKDMWTPEMTGENYVIRRFVISSIKSITIW
jgi:hypothetical protein